MQLAAALALALTGVVAPAAARADGTLSLRGAYYKERSTRVVQPMLDASLEVGAAGALELHGLVDSITSASPDMKRCWADARSSASRPA